MTTTIKLGAFLITRLAGAAYSSAQAAGATAPDPKLLRVTRNTQSQLQGIPFDKVSCDSQGNFYLRQFDPTDPAATTMLKQGPVQTVNADGTLGPSFKITDASPAFQARDFVVANGGEVYQLAQTPFVAQNFAASKNSVNKTNGAAETRFAQYYVVQFSNGGSVKSVIKIHRRIRGFIPFHLAIFENGGILITGLAGDYQHRPFTALFDSTGHLLKKIYEPEDEDSRLKAEGRHPAYVYESTQFGNYAVTMGGVATGPDGNAYLLRSTAPAVIQVISPTGDVIRKFYVDPGREGFLPISIKTAPGGIAVVFRKNRYSRDALIKVVGYAGQQIATHSFDKSLPVDFFGCYVPPAFLFTKTDANKTLHLVQVEPK